MIARYFKIAMRNLAKQKALAFINVFGLSVGLACFILFLLFTINEFSFDRFHKNKENIYRVYLHIDPIYGQAAKQSSYLPAPLGPALKQDFTEVEDFVRYKDTWEESFVRTENNVSRNRVSFADPRFFSVFSFRILYGDAQSPLKNPGNMVITKSKAIQLFGQANVVGKSISVKVEDEFDPFIITAVADDIPANSSIRFDLLASFEYYLSTKGGKIADNNWHRSGYQTFVALRPGSKIVTGSAQLRNFRAKYYSDEAAELKKDHEWKKSGSPIYYGLQPLRQMHTDTKIGGGSVEAINPKNIWILLSIAFGILLIACINFTTLAIGRSAGRAREVGVRKVLGSGKKQLIVQFLSEALLLSILSAGLGLLLGKFLLPYFNRLAERELTFSFSHYPELTWLLAGLVLLVGLLAGSYPALILSRFKPVEVLKSKIRVGGSNIFTRSLVTLQFVLSIGLIISTGIILQQLNYMKDKDPGFSKENIVMVDAEGMPTKKIYPIFKQSLINQSSIAGVTSAELGLGEGTGWSMSGFQYNGKQKNVFEYFVDADYLRVMGIKLLAGRNFDSAISNDTINSVIINEAMMNDFGWTLTNAIGQQLKGYSENLTPVVVGVVRNFNFRPFSEKVDPQMFQMFHDYAPYKFFVKIKPGNPAPALNAIQKAWSGAVPGFPLKYDFLDESLNRFYKAESKWSNIVGWAGGISIFLACLGLFGLAALAAVNRTKEIGIRKVLGASLPGIIKLLSKDFLKLICIAVAIAAPLAWYFMDKWLQDFAYRVSMSGWVFMVAGSAALIVAFVTIAFQAIKAGVANPVTALRSE